MAEGPFGNPRSGSKVWEAPDREVGKSGENRGQIVAHPKFQPAAAFREPRESLRPLAPPVDCRCVSSSFYPERLVALNSPPGYCSIQVLDIPNRRLHVLRIGGRVTECNRDLWPTIPLNHCQPPSLSLTCPPHHA